jgi:transposase
MHIYMPGLSLAVKAYIYSKGDKDDHTLSTEKEHIKSSKDLHFIDFLRFSTSSRKNFSESAAREALERATSTFAVTAFKSCWVLLSWSRREWIRESSLVEGAHLSMVEEELPTISYKKG